MGKSRTSTEPGSLLILNITAAWYFSVWLQRCLPPWIKVTLHAGCSGNVCRRVHIRIHTYTACMDRYQLDTSCEFTNDLNACDSTADDEDMVCFSCCCSPLCKFLEPSGPEQPVVILDVRSLVRAACGNYNCIGFIFLACAVARDIFHNTVRYGCDFLDIYEAGAVNSWAVAEEERSVVREQDLMFTSRCSVMIV